MELKSIRKAYEGRFLTYYIASYISKSGNPIEYEFISRNHHLDENLRERRKANAVSIIALSKDLEKVVLLQEFRPAVGEIVYGFPAGLIETSEKETDTLKRELKEETGLEVIKIINILNTAYSNTGISDESAKTIICTVDGNIQTEADEREEITARFYSKDEAKSILINNQNISTKVQLFLYMWIKGVK